MNKTLMLKWLCQDAEKNGDRRYKRRAKLEDALYGLNNWKENAIPTSLPKNPEKMMRILRQHFNDNVTFISLVLNHYFPEDYLFYRVSKLTDEIFEGLEFFSEVVPEFNKLRKVGKTGFTSYLELNKALFKFARTRWPKQKKIHRKLMYFLYEGLGYLFLEKNNDTHYWLMAAKPDNFKHLDAGYDVEWSGRKEMRPGDLIFMYRTAPRTAITDIYRVKQEPTFDPWGAWDGFWIDIEKVCAVNDITFAEMNKDRLLSQWGLVKRRFVGTVTEPIPYVMYNRLLEKIPTAKRREHHFEFEPTLQEEPLQSQLSQTPTLATPERSGQFTSEAEFEDAVILPLLRRWGFKYKRQHPCRFRVGSQYSLGRVDFYVSDEQGVLTLFENKLRILNDKDLKRAVEQAKSYALLLGLPSFIVASPEGIWLYSLNWNQENLVKRNLVDEMKAHTWEEGLKSLLLEVRQ